MNGKQIAASDKVAGAWRLYEFNVTEVAKQDLPNVLAVEVFAPHKDDLGITFVDWNPSSPDNDMALWRNVYLRPSMIWHLNDFYLRPGGSYFGLASVVAR